MADRTGSKCHLNFATDRGAEFNIFDDQWFSKLVTNGGFNLWHLFGSPHSSDAGLRGLFESNKEKLDQILMLVRIRRMSRQMCCNLTHKKGVNYLISLKIYRKLRARSKGRYPIEIN
jgi:hypothetical protein